MQVRYEYLIYFSNSYHNLKTMSLLNESFTCTHTSQAYINRSNNFAISRKKNQDRFLFGCYAIFIAYQTYCFSFSTFSSLQKNSIIGIITKTAFTRSLYEIVASFNDKSCFWQTSIKIAELSPQVYHRNYKLGTRNGISTERNFYHIKL